MTFFNFLEPPITNKACPAEFQLVGFNVLFDTDDLLYTMFTSSVCLSNEPKLKDCYLLLATICTDSSKASLALMF